MAAGNDTGNEFFGSATVGERGQIVIPAQARQRLGIKPGDKLLIFSGMHGRPALSVMKAEQVSEYVARAMETLSRIEEAARGGETEPGGPAGGTGTGAGEEGGEAGARRDREGGS